MSDNLELVTLEEAAQIVGKTPHNIRDYIQRQRITKYNDKGEVVGRAKNGELRVSLKELKVFLALVNQGDEKHHRAVTKRIEQGDNPYQETIFFMMKDL